MTSLSPDLRALVAEVVREVVTELPQRTGRQSLNGAANGTSVPTAGPTGPGAQNDHRARVEPVRISDDADLDRFARHLLRLFENPKTRQDLRAGRLAFRLERGSATAASQPASQPATRIESGAVTERHIKAAAESGRRIILGPRAVLTPLGREKARALGVPIEKER